MYTQLFILIICFCTMVQGADLSVSVSESQGRSAVFEPRTRVAQPDKQDPTPPWILHVPPQKKSTPYTYGCCTCKVIGETTHHGCCNASCEPTISCCPKWTAFCLQTMVCCPPTALLVCATSPCWIPCELNYQNKQLNAGVVSEGSQQWYVCKRCEPCLPPGIQHPHIRPFILEAYRLPVCWPCASFYGYDDQAHCTCNDEQP